MPRCDLIPLILIIKTVQCGRSILDRCGTLLCTLGKSQDMKTEDDKARNNNIIPQEAQDHAS